MAWLGAIALIGLIVCGIDAVHNLVRARKERSLPRGRAPAVLVVDAATHRVNRRRRRSASWCSSSPCCALVLGGSTRPTKLVVAPTTSTSTTTTPLSGSTTTTEGVGPPRSPQTVHVDVLNGSGRAASAAVKTAAITRAGYRIASSGATTIQTSTIVECRAGYDADTIALARVVGPGTLIQGFPNQDPPGSKNADCVVVLGP